MNDGLIRNRLWSRLKAVFLIALLAGLAAAGGYFLQKLLFPENLTLKPGVLTVLTRRIPTAYYVGPDGPAGFEYEMAAAFAKALNLRLEIKLVDSISATLSAMAQNQADLAAGGMTRTAEREKAFVFGPDYELVQQLLVYRRGQAHPREINELPEYQITIPTRSSYEERLRQLRRDLPALKWQSEVDSSTDQLLARVWRGELECTIADSNILDANLRYYPELEVAFPVSSEQPLAWIVNSRQPRLRKKLEQWFYRYQQQGRFKALKQRHFGHRVFFDYVDIKVFTRRLNTLLPKYRRMFESAGRQFEIPWTLLAAKAYQESHWNPKAISPTGVRGLMMLTRKTAAQMGVKNRLAPAESIRGGAQYLRRLLNRLPDGIRGRDRYNLALAAYNVGFGHLHDARQLARKLNKNPDSWNDMKTVLPLLSQEKYFRKLKHGYARGYEPVHFVERINNYRNILEKKLGLFDQGNPAYMSKAPDPL